METNTERNDNKIYQLFRQDLHDEMLEMFDKFMAAADKRAEAKAMEMLFDEEQVKNTCKVSSTTLWRWAKSGYLTPIFVGGKKRWRRSDIMALIEQGGRA